MNLASSWSIFSQLRDIHMRLNRQGQGDICKETHVVSNTQGTELSFHDLQCQSERTKMTMNSLTIGCLRKSLKAMFYDFYGLHQELQFWGQNERELFSVYMLQSFCNLFSIRNRQNYPILLNIPTVPGITQYKGSVQ